MEKEDRKENRRLCGSSVWLIMVGAVCASVVLSLFCGRYGLDPFSVIQAISKTAGNDMAANIIWSVRLPRIILTLLVGAGLAISGASFQGVFQNPLVSPDVLSVSSGAAFGAVLGIMIAGSSTVIMFLALTVGIVSVFITYSFSRINGKVTILSLVLSGMIISALFNALISLMKYVADTDTQLPAITYWLLGSFASATYTHVFTILAPVLAGCAFLLLMGHRINILSLGDDEAFALGINPAATRCLVIGAATLVTAACITVTGIVGWVGLVIPHIARFLVGPNHTKLLPASLLIGAAFMTLVDLIARTWLATELPVGILTAFVGAPFFAVLFRRQGQRS